MSDLEFTGERVVPGKVNDVLWAEHMGRYLFATKFACDKTVLDAGCGAGYGAEVLARHARRVTAIDISPDAVRYAEAHYRHENLEYRVMDVSALDFAEQKFDLVTSFEVIEHLTDQEKYLAGIVRVLAPDGTFIVSTPDRDVYRHGNSANPFHTRELNLEEFSALLKRYFSTVQIYWQDYVAAVAITPVSADGGIIVVERSALRTQTPYTFFVAVCTNGSAGSAEPALIHVSEIEWQLTLQELTATIPRGSTFILIDDEQFGDKLAPERTRIPFLEKDGGYWGPPADDATTVRELDRLRESGAAFVVIASTSFWWLTHYAEFARHLRANHRCVLESPRLVIFHLRE